VSPPARRQSDRALPRRRRPARERAPVDGRRGGDHLRGGLVSATLLGGWGRFPTARCQVFRPERRAPPPAGPAGRAAPPLLARGLGRSYGDAALNADGGVIVHDRLDRMLAFDAARGVLHCEGGVSIGDVLRWWLPRGWFPPVSPGTKFVTLGGAIAADIHGKN